MWFAKVKETYGEDLQIEWEPFLLAQVNSKEGPEWKAWEHTDDAPNTSLLDMRAGEAARRQGAKAFEAFQITLLKARHEDRKELWDPETVMEAAESSGLDMARFREDLADKAILDDLAESHTGAVEEHGVFGVPTMRFGDGPFAFVKTFRPPDEDAVEMFDSLMKLGGKWNYIGELKRPQPPWPKGVHS